MNKKAVIELSMATLIVVILSLTVLVIGFVFITDVINDDSDPEVIVNATDYGKVCYSKDKAEDKYNDFLKEHNISAKFKINNNSLELIEFCENIPIPTESNDNASQEKKNV